MRVVIDTNVVISGRSKLHFPLSDLKVKLRYAATRTTTSF